MEQPEMPDFAAPLPGDDLPGGMDDPMGDDPFVDGGVDIGPDMALDDPDDLDLGGPVDPDPDLQDLLDEPPVAEHDAGWWGDDEAARLEAVFGDDDSEEKDELSRLVNEVLANGTDQGTTWSTVTEMFGGDNLRLAEAAYVIWGDDAATHFEHAAPASWFDGTWRDDLAGRYQEAFAGTPYENTDLSALIAHSETPADAFRFLTDYQGDGTGTPHIDLSAFDAAAEWLFGDEAETWVDGSQVDLPIFLDPGEVDPIVLDPVDLAPIGGGEIIDPGNGEIIDPGNGEIIEPPIGGGEIIDPGNGEIIEPPTGGGDIIDPGNGEIIEPPTGGGDTIDPGNGEIIEPPTGGGDTIDPGNGEIIEPPTGGGDTIDPGNGEIIDPGNGGASGHEGGQITPVVPGDPGTPGAGPLPGPDGPELTPPSGPDAGLPGTPPPGPGGALPDMAPPGGEPALAGLPDIEDASGLPMGPPPDFPGADPIELGLETAGSDDGIDISTGDVAVIAGAAGAAGALGAALGSRSGAKKGVDRAIDEAARQRAAVEAADADADVEADDR